MSKTGSEWMGRKTIKEQHHKKLELDSAINQFAGNMPKDVAESKAHNEYVRSSRIEGAAHHLTGMKSALAGNDKESAKKHSILYSLHVQALGHNPSGEVPEEVAKHIEKNPPKVHKFIPHPSDLFNL